MKAKHGIAGHNSLGWIDPVTGEVIALPPSKIKTDEETQTQVRKNLILERGAVPYNRQNQNL